MKESEMIKVCPKCGSIHINWIAGGVAGAVYKCDDCEYVGAFILEVRASELGRFQEEMRKTGTE
ncbi:MAG: hypothetical protein M1304_02735 [Candidatus Thermoplasmatota archaeon]|nr:hypothetical protein [Candidatus Thermoplasmatota archaeon]MCL5732107.1 hypothetical protein [Candidatus Thermoplasmatota archaeon]WMT44692.1 MAG: hypothetical protein RE469_00465 [Cuniculiplasma divulgatum]